MNNTLEQSVLYGCLTGHLSYETVKPHLKLFSKPGKVVWKALEWLHEQGQEPPYTPQGVSLVCTETLGAERSELEGYIRECLTHVVGREIETVLQSCQDSMTLIELQGLIVHQMSKNAYDPEKFLEILERSKEQKPQRLNLAEEMAQEKEEHGAIRIRLGSELRSLQEETGGLCGTWVVGGLPGAGKSTLAWQLALTVGERSPVLFYDLENTKRVLYQRTIDIFDGDTRKAHEALRRVSVRTEPREVFRDVYELDEPGFVVIDSLQKLPAEVNYKRETMEKWLAKLDRLKQKGHSVLIVSQLNRSDGDYKGTNDINHSADVGLILENPMDNPLLSEVHIVKNRHGIKRGFVCQLRRHNNWSLIE